MIRKVAATIALTALVAPATASASSLSIARARPAIAKALHVTVHRCHTNGPLKVRCQVSEVVAHGSYAGWTFTFTAEATLRASGAIDVTTPDF